MSMITAMADFVSRTSFDSLRGETVGHMKMHLLDSLGAMLAGPATPGRSGHRPARCAALALAALYPERLFDVAHEPHTDAHRVGALMAKIGVQRPPELERYFPAIWPARVEVVPKKGSISREMLHPKGDADNRFTWDELASKFRWVAGPSLGEPKAEQVAQYVEAIDGSRTLTPLLELLT